MKRRQQIRLRLGMLLVVMLCGLTGVQQAEAQAAVVTLRLSSPANETSARLTAAVYKQDGAIVGQFAGTLLLFGTATASVTTSVTTVPDTVEVTLQVPHDGTLTTLVIDPVAFDTPIFLPNPSVGGTITPGLGNPDVDPFLVLSVAEVSNDRQPPTCVPSQPTADTIELTVQDTESGLAVIMVSLARNVTVVVPAVTPGTTAPVSIIATILDPMRTSTVLLQVRDEAGNQTFCKHSVRRSQTTRSRSFTP